MDISHYIHAGLLVMQPKLTSNDFLHLEWNSKLIPKLVDLSVVEYSVSKAFIIEHEISSWNIKKIV